MLIGSLIIPLVAAGCSNGLGSLTDSGTAPSTTTAGLATATTPISEMTLVSLGPIQGLPETNRQQFLTQLDAAATPRKLAILLNSNTSANFSVSGTLSARRVAENIELAYDWTIRNQQNQTLRSVKGNELALASSLSTSTSTPSQITVQAGDTLSKLAEKHGTTVSAIRDANGLDGTLIKVGQKLSLPGSGDPWSAVTPALNQIVINKLLNGLAPVS